MNNQRAYCRDCMDAMREYPDGYFELAIVDPVYGDVKQGGYMTNQMGKNHKTTIYRTALWKQPKTDKEYFDELRRVSKNQIVWGGNYFAPYLPASTCWIVWDKLRAEGVMYADCELAWTSFGTTAKTFRFKWDGFIQGDMKNKEKRIHPTQKPVVLYEWLLKNYAQPGDKILDTHLGSGSSRIAAYNLDFDFTGFEIDKGYFEDQEKRWKAHTQQMNMFELLGGEYGKL